MDANRNRSFIMRAKGSGPTVQTDKITATSGAEFLIEKLKKNYPLSIVHETWIQNVCEAIEENERRKK